jgi:hypothetical protein
MRIIILLKWLFISENPFWLFDLAQTSRCQVECWVYHFMVSLKMHRIFTLFYDWQHDFQISPFFLRDAVNRGHNQILYFIFIDLGK